MKRNFLLLLAVALIANGMWLRTAHAQSFTSLDSDLFAPGTNVSNAFQGVTLQSMTLVETQVAPFMDVASFAPVYATAGNLFSSDPNDASGWGPFFGPFDGSCLTSCLIQQGSNFGTNLLVSFSTPVDQVYVSQIGNAFNGVALEAFNSSNQEVGFCGAAPGMDLGPGNYGCYSVLSNHAGDGQWQVTTSLQAPDISKVIIGGFNNGGDQVNTIRYMAAPEIDPASVASGITLLLGSLVVMRGRRPMKLDSAAA
jgi:hypothetical protein